MKYLSFEIKNFKGIKHAKVDLRSLAGANVYAFVGLNESGKTTVLEAIHSFSPDLATSELIGGKGKSGVSNRSRVPRHLLSEFTGNVSVKATVSVNEEDKKLIHLILLKDHGLTIDLKNFPTEIELEDWQEFKGGDFVREDFTLRTTIKIKTDGQRKFREGNFEEEVAVTNTISSRVPDIVYFPTFVFDFPETVYLTQRGSRIDKFYRRVFQDILDHDGRGQTLQKDIVGRVRRKEMVVPWQVFWSMWSERDDREKIQQVMDRAGMAVTRTVFGRWNKIFGEDTRGKEIIISFEIVEGEVKDSSGASSKSSQHDIKIKFQIRDGTKRFNVNDRSLGFRWFFSFMLFTQFRVARSGEHSRPLFFLFDEPASNLHAAAQQRLIESFPQIAQGEHVLAYSTHSHYMIEPKWLEQTFIVTNRADSVVSSVLDQVSLDDESLDIQVSTYRSFVNQHPNQTSYFQPILDRLQVVPSRFDLTRKSVVVEGKSDYYVIRYILVLLKFESIPLIPGLGAGTFAALASLHIGWNLEFLFILDADKQGELERKRYNSELGVPLYRLCILTDLVEGISDIESLLDLDALETIQAALYLDKNPTKGQISRFFQERLASDTVIDLGASFRVKAGRLVEGIMHRLNNDDVLKLPS